MNEPRDSVPAKTGEGHAAENRRAHILLVDDEPTVLKVMGMSLRALGYTVVTAGSAKEGLQVASEAGHPPFDLLITDLRMPDMNGKDFAQRFLRISPDGKVIFISGLSRAAAEERAGLEAVDQFLPKPVSIIALKQTLAAVLGS